MYRCGFLLADLPLRLAQPDDLNFVRAQWVQSFVRVLGTRHFEAAALFPAKETLRAGEWALASRLLERSTVPIIEEVTPTGKRIVAFAVVDCVEPLIHYAFTVESERRKGHFKRILENALPDGWAYTRVTPCGRAVGEKLHGRYDPYRIYDLLAPTGV